MPMVLVVRVSDTQANQQFDKTFERFPVRIGRNVLNDFQVERPYVSQFHAAIDVRDRQIFVRDLGSTNGTMYAGRRLVRDTPVDITAAPEMSIGPMVLRLSLQEQAAKAPDAAKSLLDSQFAGASAGQRPQPIAPGAEDPYVRQLVPYIDAFRTAWGQTCQMVSYHLTHLPPELRTNYIKRVGIEHPLVAVEADFQKLAQYYGVDPRTLREMGPPDAALAALGELTRALVPGAKAPEDVAAILAFARRLRDTLDVFLKCFISLRDGHQEFTTGVLAKERSANGSVDKVATAKDAKELADVLFGTAGGPEASRQLHDIFVEVMSHQVKLLDGVMVGVRQLLVKLSPQAIETETDKRGKRTGIFANKYEALWKSYEERHGDYSGEDKQVFLIIFGPQFANAYAASAGEDYNAPGDAAKNLRFTVAPNQAKR